MHSEFEKEKYIEVNTMSDRADNFRKARRKNPYAVITINHQDIFDLHRITKPVMRKRAIDNDGNKF